MVHILLDIGLGRGLTPGEITMKHRLLLVDNDAILLQFMDQSLREIGYLVETAKCGAEAIEKVKTDPKRFSLVILDFEMPGQDGAAVAEQLVAINPDMFILIYSGKSSRNDIIATTRNGARGFVDKEEGIAVFHREVARMCQKYENEYLTTERALTPTARDAFIFSVLKMVGCSTALYEIAEKVEKLQKIKRSVLIVGESGTGKECVAKVLHGGGPFFGVNCAKYAMSKDTSISELFGHVKGSFTGAVGDRVGIFEEAKDGTVFLDEVYSLPHEAQIVLLRAFQEKVITRLGSTKEIPIYCRILAAAKPDIMQDIAKHNFIPDLYYRICQNEIKIPPLRDRREDIGPLVTHFCKQWAQENKKTIPFLASTLPILERHCWPGNVRELENVVYSLLHNAEKTVIGPSDLAALLKEQGVRVLPSEKQSLRAYVESVERDHLIEVCSKCWTQKEAADKLVLSPQALIRLFEKHGLVGSEVVGSLLPKRTKARGG